MIRLLLTGLACWSAVSVGCAYALSRILRNLQPIPAPDPVDDPADWLLDAPVDTWPPLRVNAEFDALITAENLQ